MRVRAEPFGAWVRVDDATLVAVSRKAARKLGVDGGAAWLAEPAPSPSEALVEAPLEVHLAVTSRCGAGCTGCYLDARPDGEVPPFDVIAERLAGIARAGAFTVAFGGGEPLGRPDLGALAAHARTLGLVPVVTTSGIGMTEERARSLHPFAQVNVSYDGEGEDYANVRGFDGAAVAEKAMRLLAGASVPYGVNVVLTRGSFDRLSNTLARAEALGAREAQLLRYKPAGRATGLDYFDKRLAPAQVDALLPLLERLSGERTLALRVDCALVPLLGASVGDPALLARFGVFGCEAGRHLAAATIDGRVAPCSFAEATEIDVGSLREGHAEDTLLARFRTLPDAEPCASCPIRSVCRGGCKIVSAAVLGAHGPDPECPRVRAHRHAAD